MFYFPGEKGDIVKIRGPKEDVDKCHKHLMKLVKELNESNHVLEVPIFKQFHKFVIGKGGVNIRKVSYQIVLLFIIRLLYTCIYFYIYKLYDIDQGRNANKNRFTC